LIVAVFITSERPQNGWTDVREITTPNLYINNVYAVKRLLYMNDQALNVFLLRKFDPGQERNTSDVD
jgi:hypothetical protein